MNINTVNLPSYYSRLPKPALIRFKVMFIISFQFGNVFNPSHITSIFSIWRLHIISSINFTPYLNSSIFFKKTLSILQLQIILSIFLNRYIASPKSSNHSGANLRNFIKTSNFFKIYFLTYFNPKDIT